MGLPLQHHNIHQQQHHEIARAKSQRSSKTYDVNGSINVKHVPHKQHQVKLGNLAQDCSAGPGLGGGPGHRKAESGNRTRNSSGIAVIVGRSKT